MMRRLGWMACVGTLGLLAGCAQTPTRGTGAPADLNALYAQLQQASSEYDQALDQARRGDNAQSQKTLEAALDAMRSASDKCVNTAGCDTARFLSAYDRALRLKDGSFLGTEDDEQAIDNEDKSAAGSNSGVLATLPQAQRTVQLLHDHKLSDLVATNGTVQAALQVWLTRLRPNLIRAYVDYRYLRYQMEPAFHKAGLPEAILFGLIAKESGGRVHAVSRSGAAGPLQFMPATGARFGLNTVNGFDQRFDP
ncbi:MAG: transglycosylase SLT domain-containing protein, partial [Rhodanobacteraceae bacterium]